MNRSAALDKIGDQSSEEQRRQYFREVDKDQSDGVDFEEFLEVYIYIHDCTYNFFDNNLLTYNIV